jgi:peptidylprolyl isomerase
MNSKRPLFGVQQDHLEKLLALDLQPPAYSPPSGASTAGYVGDREDNPVVYLEISAGGRRTTSGHTTRPRVLGRLYFELRRDLVPAAAMNFMELCAGTKGVAEDGINYHYKGTRIHRIVKDGFFQGGDLLGLDGECSRSVYDGRYFRDENFIFRHTGPGCLSYSNRGPDTNGSLFQVTFCRYPDFDEQYVVFGCMVDDQSFQVLREINRLGIATGEPQEEVSISDSGIAFQRTILD